ncbi:unnamed protein product [Periconia digitata]|uniref:Uncharacterized protein n=1 Tax=Periconia digitata TaxID=1303443 RepID=A0A9W4UNH0_9PLEO|nr:unnamed protein product [Periconia digitata]
MTTRRRQGSLGDSWEEAYTPSSNESSIHTASSESEEELSAPLPPRITASAPTQGSTTGRARTARQSSIRRGSGNALIRSTVSPSQRSSQQSDFKMPSIDGELNHFYRPSPRAKKQVIHRRGSPDGNQPKRPRRSQRKARGPLDNENSYTQLFWEHVLLPTLKYTAAVVGDALQVIRPLLGLLLCVLIALSAMQYSKTALYNRILGPVCHLPGSTYIVPFCRSLSPGSKVQVPDSPSSNFEELGVIQSMFAEVMEANKDAYWGPPLLRKSNTDLIAFKGIIMSSALPSRNEIGNEVENYIQATDATVSRLIEYNSAVGATVDHVIHSNRHAIQQLNSIDDETRAAAAQNLLSRTLTQISPWGRKPAAIEARLFEQYTYQISFVSSEIETLIEKAYNIETYLQDMDKLIGVIQQIAHQDKTTVTNKREQVETSLWFGIAFDRRTRSKLQDFDKILGVIETMFEHRDSALEAVHSTIEKLRELRAHLGHLKEDVDAPRLEGYQDGKKPLRYHIEAIDGATNRLKHARDGNKQVADTAREYTAKEYNERQKTIQGFKKRF